MIEYEHVFPPLKTCDFSPLEHQASGVSYILPLSKWLSIELWCDLSLPLWHQFPRRALLDFCVIAEGFGPWVTKQVECDASRGQESLSGAGAKKCRNKWQVVFSVVKSVAPSCVLRLHRKNSVGPKATDRCDRVHYSETLVTSAH